MISITVSNPFGVAPPRGSFLAGAFGLQWSWCWGRIRVRLL